MYSSKKANDFINYLEQTDLSSAFQIQEDGDAVLFIREEIHDSARISFMIAISDSIKTEILFFIVDETDPSKRDVLLSVMNQLNKEYILKVYMRESGDIVGGISYFSTEEDFNSDTLLALVSNCIGIVARNVYPRLMQAIWSES